tara:strand:- start:10116 stop:10730 length:615 start_codon:yes stop_codon:yes gene_type:complete
MYAQLTENEIKTLSEHKASGAAWAVYTALAAHAWKKAEVFPSIKRIQDVIGGHYTRRTIYAALRFLDKVGLIVRKAATVKERFTLALKKAAKVAKHGAARALHDSSQVCKDSHHKRKQKRKNNLRYSNKLPTAAQKDFNSMNQEHKTKAEKWIDQAILYICGETDTIDPPHCKRKVSEALNNSQNAAVSMFADEIRAKLPMMLI